MDPSDSPIDPIDSERLSDSWSDATKASETDKLEDTPEWKVLSDPTIFDRDTVSEIDGLAMYPKATVLDGPETVSEREGESWVEADTVFEREIVSAGVADGW